MTMDAEKKIRVLIVDDSAFMRKVLEEIISSDPRMEVVGQARDGREAVAMAASLQPDVVTMDINMPRMDGLEATQVIMTQHPRPILIVSSESREGASSTLRGLELGAIDFVSKPSSGIDLDMKNVKDELLRKLKMAAKVRVVRTATMGIRADRKETIPAPRPAPTNVNTDSKVPLVVIAASTGGPATLMNLVPKFPRDFPAAIILVQHMPAAFTSQLSVQLAEVAAIRVKEAEHRELIRPGVFYVCPGSHHLRISSGGQIALDDGPRISGYKPCADVTLESAAVYAGPHAIAVVLTGMGGDGARGVQAVKAAGGWALAQDEATSVIFGMPAEAIRTGAVNQVLGIQAMYPAIEKRMEQIGRAIQPVGVR
jgi:two-component system, chemotaxis family, protein-glutamate methylesterase/glutaminase